MEQRKVNLRPHETGGGRVTQAAVTRLTLPAGPPGYANAQIDDYGPLRSRRDFAWTAGTQLSLRARFSHEAESLAGTAGFGFWNAPFGDPRFRLPALPLSVWFFFASPPSDLPLAESGPGQGWFASTLDARRPSALAIAPLAPVVLVLNNLGMLQQRIWPAVRNGLAISFAPVETDMTGWHDYAIDWQADGCRFFVDGTCVLSTTHSPTGPLGFVCWVDNQYLIATPRGRLSAGIVSVAQDQWLEMTDFVLRSANQNLE